MRRITFMGLLLVSLLLVFSACSGKTEENNYEGNSAEENKVSEPQDGGILRMAFGSEEFKDTLIPGLASDAFNKNLVRILFDGLAYQTGVNLLIARLGECCELILAR